jgi:MATE family multidrug resistance protein
MATDLTVNGLNILMSIVLALGLSVGGWHYEGMGFPGVAAGTVAAQYSGLLVALTLLLVKYRRSTLSTIGRADLHGIFKGDQMHRFMTMNADLFVRSLCFIAIYIGFTVISARYGDTLLAVSSILMKLLMIFSYFTDGFAYAGEALVGRYIGAGDHGMYKESVKWTFIWSMSIALIFMGIYHFAGVPMLKMMTSDAVVVDASREYLPWLLLMPIVGCAAFTWDGIYIGATASRQMRDSMLWAVVAFAGVWLLGILLLNNAPSLFSSGLPVADALDLDVYVYNRIAMHILMAAYFAHLLARTVYLTVRSKCCFPK